MKFLNIEDDDYKAKSVATALREHEVVRERSYNTGLRNLISNTYDGVILDMGLPVFDDGHGLAPDRGILVLMEMRRKKINIPVMIYSGGQKQEFNLDQFDNVLCFVHASAYVSVDNDMAKFVEGVERYKNSNIEDGEEAE